MAHSPHRFRAAPWCLLLTALTARAVAPPADWQFSVLLDGHPIGTHRFELAAAEAGSRALLSEARFDVKILGFTAYRYRHRAEEHWSGDCLHSLTSTTDDDGEVTVVNGTAADGGFIVLANTGSKPSRAEAAGCLVNFAYWNPQQLAQQRQLLDQGTGRIESVTITALPASTIQVRGTPTAATGLRITGLKRPIDVWYANGRWVGLDSTVESGRKLTYRLP